MRRVLRSAGRASASVGVSLAASSPAAPPAAAFATGGARWMTAPPPRGGPPPPPGKTWTVTFEEGRRVFRSGNERYGEQWYETEPAKGYYFKLDTKGEAVGESLTEDKVPFKPNKVSNWQLVADGVRWKPTGQVWTRHAAPDGTPFYSNGHVTDWAPQPPLPPKPGHPQQPLSHGGGGGGGSAAPARSNWGAEPLHAGRAGGGGGGASGAASNVPAVVRGNNSVADPLATGGPLRAARQREIQQLEQMKSYTVKPCPLNPSETLPMGSYVYFMQDFKVLCTRIDNHPATTEKLSDKALSQLHKAHCDRFQIVRWSRKQGETLGGIRVLIESTKHRGRDDVLPLSMWVPANCLVTPSKFNAHSCAKLQCMICDFTAKDSAGWARHLLKEHNECVKRCPKCQLLIHIETLAEHDSVCTASVPPPQRQGAGSAASSAPKEEAKVEAKEEAKEEAKVAEKKSKKSKKDEE